MNGIDIYEGNDITDFNALKNQGVEVIIAKATQGVDYVDHSFAYRCSHVRQAGIKFGAYHFAGGLHSAESEAQHFLDVIKGQTFDTVMFLDIENYGSKTWGKQEAINFCNAWLNYVKVRGYKVGIYTNESLYDDLLKGNIPEDVVLWLANYSNKPATNCSWQYSENGRLNGAGGDLDLDEFQDDILVDSLHISAQGQPQRGTLPSNFSESYYLKNNPDVANAVSKGTFKSGADHYMQYGYKENRKYAVPIPSNFNDAYYLECNKDVADAVSKGSYKNGLQHYQAYGWNENRKCVPPETISYTAFVQNIGMQNEVSFDQIAGTVGRSLRMEGLTINYTGKGHLTFQGYTQDTGWQPMVENGMFIGTINQSRRLEALKINLTGSDMKLSYSVQVQNIGWMDYVQNGEVAGTTGKALRIEAIKIRLI